MAILALLQSVALIAALSFSRVFFMLDAESYRLFSSTVNGRVHALDTSVGQLVENVAREAERLGTALCRQAEHEGVRADALYWENGIYNRSAALAAESIFRLLQGNSVTGAFFLFGGSNAHPNDRDFHSGVYIRNSAPGSASAGKSGYLMEVGPTVISRRNKIATGMNWTLDISLAGRQTWENAFYENPQWAARTIPHAEIERYGYWSPSVSVLADGQEAVLYTMPLLDAQGAPFGVLGIEILLPHFVRYYLPSTDLPYENSFFAITPHSGDLLGLDWVIAGGPLTSRYLKKGGEAVPLKPVRGVDLYRAELSDGLSVYCSANQLTMYSRNSPFYEESWMLSGFVPEAVMHETSDSVQGVLVVSIALTTLISVAAIFVIVPISLRKISRMSQYIRTLSPNQDVRLQYTGLREVDDLVRALDTLNQSVRSASSTTSKILELTLLPIGGFSVADRTKTVTLTGFVCELLGLGAQTTMPTAHWAWHYKRLTERPEADYENVYQFQPEGQADVRWLRILTTPTEEGLLGVILDVTKEIEEHRRLARELDYDALTQLFNRSAFKRKVYQKIQEAPERIGAMIFADLDNLKYINDTHGHEMGDRLIISAGDMFRRFDQYGAVVSRISGDEFAIYLHGFDTEESARRVITTQLLENERYTIGTPDGAVHRIRSSAGLSWYPRDAREISDLLKLADFAMYEAKHNQKGMLFEFNARTYQEQYYLLENREVINQLLDEGLIRFAFQPIADLRTGEIHAYELLMRSQMANFKTPLEILTVARSQSKLASLERLILMTAFQTISEHVDDLREDIWFFVNSIPSQILDSDTMFYLNSRFSELFPRVVIELTEEENNSPTLMAQKLVSIRGNHMKIAVDDYGSRYSNEIRLLAIGPDVVKIDIHLVRGIHADDDRKQLVRNLVSFCRPKGIRLVAEGVEQYEDLVAVCALGVDFVQGYYIGHPDFEIRDLPQTLKEELRKIYRELSE